MAKKQRADTIVFRKPPAVVNETEPCRCGTGYYCRRHLRYGAVKLEKEEVKSLVVKYGGKRSIFRIKRVRKNNDRTDS